MTDTDIIDEKLRNEYKGWIDNYTKKDLIKIILNLDPTGKLDTEYEDYRNLVISRL